MRPLPALVLLASFALAGSLRAAELDLSRAVVLGEPGAEGAARKAVPVLIEEIARRSHASWRRAQPADDKAAGAPKVLVGRGDWVRSLAGEHGFEPPPPAPSGRKEGYRIGVAFARGGPILWVAGDDDRGVLFGAARLLRILGLRRDRITAPADLAIDTAPRTPLRGAQIGYRPKTNSYDAWDARQWEQYIRDLAVFGCNAVELIPPRSDDADDSPHYPRPPLEMMATVSGLADAYGMDVWAWYPAMDEDYSKPETVEAALKEWGAVFAALPRLDAVFVPGGDPGHTKPGVLLSLLEKQTADLRKYHPNATMWVSPQSFHKADMDEFLRLVRAEPAWLAGIVHGPQVRMDLAELRAAIPDRYPIRDYPDITHSRHCQYPVPDWDVAFALAEGREVANPRPRFTAHIALRARPHTIGGIVYSEGCHDDVNKMVWLAANWDERTDVGDIVREYARYVAGPDLADRLADGLLALETNWRGPVLENEGIDSTLDLFQKLEQDAPPAVKRNWRFQQALYRAYFDAVVRARLDFADDMMDDVRDLLGRARERGAMAVIEEADEALYGIANFNLIPMPLDLHARVGELAEALFQSIGAQLSVEKYGGIALERGASLDTLDVPLTEAEAAWLRARLAEIKALDSEDERLARLDALLNRTDPGPGGSYDDLGDPANQPHLVRGAGPEEDPANYASAYVGFGVRGRGAEGKYPRAWWHQAETLYDTPLKLHYDGLDPAASYRVRAVYGAAKVRLAADGREVHDYLDRPFDPIEFPVPREATADGELTLSWSGLPGRGGNGRGCAVAEVWLIKTP